MSKIHGTQTHQVLVEKLAIDCAKCSGLCCVGLYFAKSEGFPTNKAIGTPCQNLRADFRCDIHPKLQDRQLKGCLAYDCFGAGQWVTQAYGDQNWRNTPKIAGQMFDAFLVVYQLHEMLWYLLEAATMIAADALRAEIEALILENQQLTAHPPEALQALDSAPYQAKVNRVLKKVTELAQSAAKIPQTGKKNGDCMGKNFKKANLDGRDLSMTLLIAANLEGCSLRGTNFLGSDLRDTLIKNTDLSDSIFLTQRQINAARGNSRTKLPPSLTLPQTWES